MTCKSTTHLIEILIPLSREFNDVYLLRSKIFPYKPKTYLKNLNVFNMLIYNPL